MNIIEVLNELGIEFRQHGESPHVTPGWIGIECPYCGKGTGKYGLGINLIHLNCSCWKCSSHRLGETLAEASGRSIRAVMQLVSGVVPDHAEKTSSRGKLVLPKTGPLLKAHRAYLRGRGFDPEQIEAVWGIGGIGVASRLAWRLFIPVHLGGEVVSWTTRAIGDDPVRYVSARPEEEALPIHSLLYGEDYLRYAVVVCEGPTDAWRIGPGAVALMGVKYTQAQVVRIARYPRRIICFDPDAQERSRALASELAPFPGETLVVVPGAKDIAESSPDDIEEVRALAGLQDPAAAG